LRWSSPCLLEPIRTPPGSPWSPTGVDQLLIPGRVVLEMIEKVYGSLAIFF
jgi:hypothetical protein